MANLTVTQANDIASVIRYLARIAQPADSADTQRFGEALHRLRTAMQLRLMAGPMADQVDDAVAAVEQLRAQLAALRVEWSVKAIGRLADELKLAEGLHQHWTALDSDGTWTSGEDMSREEAEEIIASRGDPDLVLAVRWESDWRTDAPAKDVPVDEPDYMRTYREFWARIVEPGGRLDRDQIARELADYTVVMEEASKVYSELAGLSKPNTAAGHILAAAEERYAETYADFLCDRAYIALEGGDEATSLLLREIAEEWHQGSWDEHIKGRNQVAKAVAGRG